MQKELKPGTLGIAGIVLLLIALVAVRSFQEDLFYDPFVVFFRGENYSGKPLPQFNSLQLFLGLLFRYFINTVLSLAILWLFFKDRAVIKLSVLLYVIFFIVLTAAFFILLSSDDVNLLVLFYIRRFLIQPLFLILFIPAFYYQRKAK